MSLINDALKRAKEAQQQNQPATDGPPLRPAGPAQQPSAGNTKTLMYILVACVVFGNALLFLALGWKKESPKASQPAPVAVVAPAAAPPPVITTPVAAASTAPAPQPTVVVTNPLPVSVSVVGSNSPFATPAVAVEPVPPTPLPLKLQAINYSATRPSAMISGKFLFVGDKFRGMRVAAIDREAVTLIGNGETNVLSLP